MPKKVAVSQADVRSSLVDYLHEITQDEERILANLAFEPVIIGRQLQENHFTVNDFQGAEPSRVLLGTMLEILEDHETLNLPNVVAR